MSPPPIFTAPTVSTAWPTAWVDLLALKVMVPTTHICSVHCVSWPFCTNTYCIHCVLCPLCTAFTVHCIHCIHWFDLFAPKTMSPPPYTTIPLHTASTAYCAYCVLHTASTVWPTVWVDLFALKVTVPTTHLHGSLHKLAFFNHT